MFIKKVVVLLCAGENARPVPYCFLEYPGTWEHKSETRNVRWLCEISQ